MVFWRKKNNQARAEQEERDDKIMHHKGEPAIEPPTEYDPEMSEELEHRLEKTDEEILDEMEELPMSALQSEKISEDPDKGGWLSRLTSGLTKSSNKISQGLVDVLTKSKLDQDALDKLEDLLIEADLGPSTAARLVEAISKDRFGKDVTEEEIKVALAEQIEDILKPHAKTLDFGSAPDGQPFVVLVCGVNGVGKTTTIGKYAQYLGFKEKKSVMIAAGDTFRAAAIEQLESWAKKTHAAFYAKEIGDDAAAVAFESYEKALADQKDILMIDTAGRLHNKANLMEELKKVVRVLKKKDEALPHVTLLVLDATTGQNAHAQVETFKEMVDIDGLIVTKLDGSARGGVVVSLADQFDLPIYAVGVGEQADDLQPFKPCEFARSLVGLES